MDLISKSLHYIGENHKDAFVIQIGAMDGINFDDTRGFLDKYKWNALLVEPIPQLFSELKDNFKDRENYIFEKCAITEYDGDVQMLTIPPEVIERENLHPGYKGMSALYPLKNGFGSSYQRDVDVKNKFGVNIKVPSLTFESLLKKHNILNFDILICDAEGYDWSIFKQIDLEKYKPKFIRLEHINLSTEEKKLLENKLKDAGYVFEIDANIDAVLPNIWEKVKDNEILDLTIRKKSNLTLVTGLWDIGKSNVEGISNRPFSHYLECFDQLLKVNENLFIFVPKELENFVWSRRKRKNTVVKIFELSDVKNLFSPFWDKFQNLRQSKRWLSQADWLKNSPQGSLEWYNPIVMSKMSLLHDVSVFDPFNSENFAWIDAGITNTVNHPLLTDTNFFEILPNYFDPFLFVQYPYPYYGKGVNEIHGFDWEALNRFAGTTVEWISRGGLFGGKKEILSLVNSYYWHTLNDSLTEGYVGTEESIFAILAAKYPEVFRSTRVSINGHIQEFIRDALNDKAFLEEIPEKRVKYKNIVVNTEELKTSIYMLTFNFPHQVEHTIQTWLKHPKWITNTRNILIDNSTNDEARIANAEICKKYNFDHIITNENTGINGGRFRAAQHFQESDSDYYLFLEDDMGIHEPVDGFCRNGFRTYVPDLYDKALKILHSTDIDFLKLSYTEVYMDNNIQVSWYNVPQHIRTEFWPNYDRLPQTGLDPNCPRTQFHNIEVLDGLSYITGEIYYANWPTMCGKKGNQKMFLDVTWERPYEQTWMSYMFQETRKGNLKPAVLLASPINHNRIAHYTPEERREN